MSYYVSSHGTINSFIHSYSRLSNIPLKLMLTTIGHRPAKPVDARRCCSCWSGGVQLRQSSSICGLAVHARLAIVRRAGACQAGAASSVRVAENRQLPPATPQRAACRSDDVALCRSHRSSIRRLEWISH